MRKLGGLLLIAPLVFLMGVYWWEVRALDACLEQGGSFNYLQAVCDLHQSHPFVPFSARYPLLVNGCMLTSLLGLLLCFVGFFVRRAR